MVFIVGSCSNKQDPTPPEPEVNLTLPSSEMSVDAKSNGFDFTVRANCDWTLTKDADWVSITPGEESHQMTETLLIQVEENPSVSARSAHIEFHYGEKKKTFTINQEGFRPSLEVSVSAIHFGYRTAEKEIIVTSNCGWLAKADNGWVAIRPSTGLVGRFEMTVNVEANNGPERAGKIHIWNETYQLTQDIDISQDGKPETEDKDYIDEYGVNWGKGILVRGLTWAPVNCGYKDIDYPLGKMFQWGRKQGLGYQDDTYKDATTPLICPIWEGKNGEEDTNSFYLYSNKSQFSSDWIMNGSNNYWNLGTEENPIKNKEFDPCPEGWRVPTAFEFKSLINYVQREWIQEKGWNGYRFEDDATQLFLPAGGRLNVVDGEALDRNVEAYYWTNSTSEGSSSYLYLYKENCSVNAFGSRAGGCLVRCVKE
jgi:uncharacterized protein (TIGR02145 family)